MEKLLLISRITGIVLLVGGTAINYVINRRRFYRRSITGMQVFKSFERAWMTSWIEKIGKLIAWILIITGALLTFGSFVLLSI